MLRSSTAMKFLRASILPCSSSLAQSLTAPPPRCDRRGVSPIFKHANLFGLQQLPCPPAAAASSPRTGFRFVHKANDPDSFLPVECIKPRRGTGQPVSCSSCGLSMFDTEDHARKKYKALAASGKNVRLELGGHLAKGALTAADGTHHPAKPGHFDFYEYDTANLHAAFSIVGTLQ